MDPEVIVLLVVIGIFALMLLGGCAGTMFPSKNPLIQFGSLNQKVSQQLYKQWQDQFTTHKDRLNILRTIKIPNKRIKDRIASAERAMAHFGQLLADNKPLIPTTSAEVPIGTYGRAARLIRT
jgi:hypothetical protein